MKKLLLFLLILSITAYFIESSLTTTKDIRFDTLDEKIDHLNRYVPMDISKVKALSFDIVHHDNSQGFIPAPSDWDIRFIAVVTEIEPWLIGMKQVHDLPPQKWLSSIPWKGADYQMTHWYSNENHQIIGLDRGKNIIAYRHTTF